MKNLNLFCQKILLLMGLTASLSSCNQKLYQDSLKKNEALEAQVVRSNKEIKELREQKAALEDEVKAKAAEVSRLNNDLQLSQKTIEEMNTRFKGLESQIKLLNQSIETQKTENSTLISNYEQKLGDMQQEILALSKKKKGGKKRVKKV